MSIEQAVRTVGDTDTLLSAFRRTVADRGGEVAVRAHDGSLALTWGDLAERSTALAAGFAALGLGPGHTVALLLRNRPEFYPVDLAAVTIGAVTVSLYVTSAPPQLQHVLSDAGVSAVISERGLVGALDGLALPSLRFVVDGDADGEAPPGWRTLGDVVAAGAGTAFDPPPPDPGDVLTMIYTSGTTGKPKGVQITHRGVLATAVATNSVLGLPPGTTVISWLPSAHVGDRCGGYYIPMVTGWEVVTCADPRAVLDVLAGAHPGYFYGPPRIFEKLRADFDAWRAGLAADVRESVDEGLAAGYAQVRATQTGEVVATAVAEGAAAFRAGPLQDWKRSVGIDRLVVVLVATAPNPGPIMEFFHAIGTPMGEAYGLTESSGSGTVVAPDAIRIGKVGTASRGIEVRIDDTGEVLLRGPQVMAGYHNLPEATAAAIDPDGWLHTGDLGALDADGYLSIVGRAKELIISAQGKNIAPVTVESAIGPRSPLIGQICCVGDARPYLVALIVLDPVYAASWAARHGVTVDEVARDERALAEIRAAVEEGNAQLSRPEQVKRFRVLATEWLPGGEELTPTAKLRRHRIVERYAEVIDGLYADGFHAGEVS
ncbi:MAG: long-chain fatty acid--CoA ligase [Pseudonocardia sp.]|uniref:AMP-dependent synthetase/ligase n=1 Tax=Pseudonocardia sp. TaxID=60912 RepID=UPI001AC35A21|nr:AMP-dependent synthetase/ligase [Pseudonocardia sp.]MBN9099862.1 long-chain fatty acid--CoA ligase [Pseudonocardia sp.]